MSSQIIPLTRVVTSAVPEPLLMPANPAPHCPQLVTTMSHHRGATNLCSTAAHCSPQAVAGAAWGWQQLQWHGQCAHSATKPCPCPQSPPKIWRRACTSQRPRLAAGGAGSAGFQQKPARTWNGPAGRGSIWAELTMAQPGTPSTGHRQHWEPHTAPCCPTHVPCQHLPGVLGRNKVKLCWDNFIPRLDPQFGAVPGPG